MFSERLSSSTKLLRLIKTIIAHYLIFFVVYLSRQCHGQNPTPVVGILSLLDQHENYHYIAASYVKWLESAGARSIPIPYDASDELVKEIFTQINGLLFPGGSAVLPSSAKTLWKLAMESNARGEYFPVWGTCLGFEYMLMLTSNDESVIQTGFNAENVSLPLIFPTENDVEKSKGVFSIKSRLYPTSSQRQILSSSNITMNNHFRGIIPSKFIAETNLTSIFKITSTSIDLNGMTFVSSIESLDMPLYGIQYHPEKNNFEYGVYKNTSIPYAAINHSEDAVTLSLRLAIFFVGNVRKNSIGTYSLLDRHPLVYKYKSWNDGEEFEQIYIIPPAHTWYPNARTTPTRPIGQKDTASTSSLLRKTRSRDNR